MIGRVEFEAESAESAVDTLLMRKIPFDGIVAASDLIALGGIRALHRAGLVVPRDVSVVGYDNNLLSRLSTPPLSTVQQDIPKAGRVLVSKLLEWTRRGAAGDVVNRADHQGILRSLRRGRAPARRSLRSPP